MGFRGSLSSEFLPPSGIYFAMTDSNLKRWDSYISKNLPKRVTEAATALSTAGRGGPRDRDTRESQSWRTQYLWFSWGCNTATRQPGSEQDSATHSETRSAGTRKAAYVVVPRLTCFLVAHFLYCFVYLNDFNKYEN